MVSAMSKHAPITVHEIEHDIAKDYKHDPKDLSPVYKELAQLRKQDGSEKAFQKDLSRINHDLQSKHILPNLEIKEDPTAADGFKLAPIAPVEPPSPPSSPPESMQPSERAMTASSPVGDSGSGGGGSTGGGGSSGGSDSGGGGSDSGGAGSDSGAGTPGSSVAGGSIDAGTSSGLPDLNVPNLSQYYQYPITGSAVQNPERIDQGVDFGGSGQFNAIGNSVVDAILPNWYQGQPLVELTLTDGPLKGRQYYVAEGINPLVKVGEHVAKGQPIAQITGGPTGIETGWGAGGGKTLAQATTGYTEGQQTQAGQSYSQFLQKLGGPGGRA